MFVKSIYDSQNSFKYGFIVVAVCIVLASLGISYALVDDMSREEDEKMKLWANATKLLASDAVDGDFSLASAVVTANTSIPVILAEDDFKVLTHRNLPNKDYTEEELSELARHYAAVNEPIEIVFDGHYKQYIYYDNSVLLKALTYYPMVLTLVLVVFFALILVILYITKLSEQNQVWVGLSKETAHQLGTPISSLLAWTAILQQNYPNDTMIPEMSKDVNRLRTIADRFSQIGSKAELERTEVNEVVARTVAYMRKRISRQIALTFEATDTYYAMLNVPLFEWVIENLCKNAVDAMREDGEIRFILTAKDTCICLDVCDNGKGISKQHINRVFRPGFTTKKRGWGLGLSLVHRIVHEYHKGKIYVRHSEVNVGTTFRIELQKA
jgi:signal transduction histidine kinase